MASYPIISYSVCNGLGMCTSDVAVALREGKSGLGEPSMVLPFSTRCGSLPDIPLRLPSFTKRYETQLTRIAWTCLEPMLPELERAKQKWGKDRVAIVMGSSTAGMAETERAYAAFQQTGALPNGYSPEDHHSFFGVIEMLQRVTGVSGPSYVVSTACASSGKAVASAMRLLDVGLVDAALVGGVDSLCQITLRGFHSLGILSATECKPFSSHRDGISIGEGSAMLLMERTGDAPVSVLSVGESTDAYHMASPHPEGEGAEAAMMQALEHANLRPTDIGFINAHGTGTPLNDGSESKAVCRVFGSETPILSTKAYTGHLLGAAAATELVFSAIALEQGWLPKSLGAEPVDPEIHARVQREAAPIQARYACSNAFAFGGSNVSIVLGRV